MTGLHNSKKENDHSFSEATDSVSNVEQQAQRCLHSTLLTLNVAQHRLGERNKPHGPVILFQ